jgi:hypothetical protein
VKGWGLFPAECQKTAAASQIIGRSLMIGHRRSREQKAHGRSSCDELGSKAPQSRQWNSSDELDEQFLHAHLLVGSKALANRGWTANQVRVDSVTQERFPVIRDLSQRLLIGFSHETQS